MTTDGSNNRLVGCVHAQQTELMVKLMDLEARLEKIEQAMGSREPTNERNDND